MSKTARAQVQIFSPRKKLLLSAEEKENSMDMGHSKAQEPETKSRRVTASKKLEKEDSAAPRRSKRRPALADVVANTETSKEEQPAKSTRGRPKNPAKGKRAGAAVGKKCGKANLTQTKLQFSSASSPKEEDESVAAAEDASGADKNNDTYELETPSVLVPVQSKTIFEETNGHISDEFMGDASKSDTYELDTPSVRVAVESKSIFEETNILTCAHPPDSFYRELAEQRRIALEKALEENESLHDQLHVLEVENAQLKSIVQEAKEVAAIVNGMLKS